MGLRDHFIADHIEHGAAGKGQGKGQDRRGHTDREKSQQRTQHLHHAGGCRNQKGAAFGYARCQHGCHQHHTFGDILQGNAACHRQGFRCISRAEADTGGDALGQVVDGDGRYKQQHLI